jgi:hypothetical protein
MQLNTRMDCIDKPDPGGRSTFPTAQMIKGEFGEISGGITRASITFANAPFRNAATPKCRDRP